MENEFGIFEHLALLFCLFVCFMVVLFFSTGFYVQVENVGGPVYSVQIVKNPNSQE
jgi:hypothetical protein